MRLDEFKVVAKVKIDGKMTTVKKYMHGDWYRIKNRNIFAHSLEDAVKQFEHPQTGKEQRYL